MGETRSESRFAGVVRWIAVLAVIASAGLMAVIKIGDYDIWYHLRVGQVILSTGAVRQLDPFAYTASDHLWSLQSWLAGVIFFAVEHVSGIEGLIIFNAIVVAATFALVFLTCRVRANDQNVVPLIVLVLAIAAFAVRFRMSVRPHVLEFFLLSATLFVLHDYRRNGGRRLWILPAIQLLWVNIHGSHILGLALPVVFLCGELVARAPFWPRPLDQVGSVPLRRFARDMLLVSGANLVATLVNPAGTDALFFAFQLTGQKTYMANINEWQPLTFDLLSGYGARYTWAFSALGVLALTGFGCSIARRRVDPLDVALFATFFVLVCKGIRLIPEFAIAVSPVVVRNLHAPVAGLLERWPRLAASAALAGVALVVTPAWALDGHYAFGLGNKPGIFPDDAIAFIESAGVQGKIFNSFAFGDYLTWRAPERKVFIHGRNDVFPESFYERYVGAHRSREAWRRLVDEYRVDYALLEYYRTDYASKEAIPHLAEDPEWIPVYWDRTAIVYVRIGPRNRSVADRFGYKLIRPTRLDFSYLDPLLARGKGPEILAEFDRLIAQSPDNEEAYLGKAFVSWNLGGPYKAGTKPAIVRALEIEPGRAMSHSALGLVCMEEGLDAIARREFETALGLDPTDLAACDAVARLRRRRR